MKNYLKLLQFLKGHRKLFFIAVSIMFVASFFEAFQMSMLVPMVDIIFTGKEIVIPNRMPNFVADFIRYLNEMDRMRLLPLLLTGFGVMVVFKNCLVFSYQYLMGDVSQRLMRDIRFRLYQTIQHLSLDYFSEKRTGELISRITHDVNLMDNAISYGLTDLFRQTFMIIFWMTICFTIEPQSAFMIFVVFPIIGLPMSKIGRHLKKISKGVQEQVADINSLLLETISGIKLVKAFNMEAAETERYKIKNHGYYKLTMKSIKRLILISPITEIVGSLFGIVLILWFGPRMIEGEMSFGVFILFFGAIMSIISPAKKLGNVNAITQRAMAANDRIYDILDAKPTVHEKEDALIIGEMRTSMVLDAVGFEYSKESGQVLKDINLEIKKGELVAVVGPTGTGKTTLASLLTRFYDPTQGRVMIDGVDLRDVTFASLRSQMGVVTQETILFNDTVKANIAYGYPQATDEEIEAAARKAFAHRFIIEMPEGYNTVIGDRGFRLSGGEKQRLTIARAILRNPPILILDEATSQLDSESEHFVQEALNELMRGRTVLAIAHRLSTIKRADKIVVLDKGQIVGVEQHDVLLKTCPLYERLHARQFHVDG